MYEILDQYQLRVLGPLAREDEVEEEEEEEEEVEIKQLSMNLNPLSKQALHLKGGEVGVEVGTRTYPSNYNNSGRRHRSGGDKSFASCLPAVIAQVREAELRHQEDRETTNIGEDINNSKQRGRLTCEIKTSESC